MLVCGSHSSVFVREKCWYVVVIAVYKREMLVCGSYSSVFVRVKF